MAKEVWTKKPSYPEVWNLLAKIHEEEDKLEEALTAYMTYVTLRYPAKTIEPEITFNAESNDHFPGPNDSNSDDSDSDFSDHVDDGKTSKRPTAQLIQKIASLALKSEKYETALEMIGKMEGYYRPTLQRLNDPKYSTRISARWTAEELELKKSEIQSFLETIYRQKVSIYKIQRQFDRVREEYEKRYVAVFRDRHPHRLAARSVSRCRLREH